MVAKEIYGISDLHIAAWLLPKGSQFQTMARSDVRPSNSCFQIDDMNRTSSARPFVARQQ